MMATETPTRSNSQDENVNFKISRHKVHQLSNLNLKNDEVQVLHINCQNSEEAQKLLANFCFDDFPNIFVVVSECENLHLTLKVSRKRKIILEIKSQTESKFYQKSENDAKFTEISVNKKLNARKSLELKDFFGVLKSLNASLLEVDLIRILASLKLSRESGIFQLLKNAIKTAQLESMRILLLFVDELSEELFDEVLQSKNVAIWVILCSNFALNNHQVEKMLSHKLNKDFLIELAEQGNVKILKMFIKSPKVFAKHVDYETWNEIIKISEGFEFSFNLQMIEDEFYDDDEIKELHESIESGNFCEVKTFTKKNPHFKLCVDDKNISALEKAINCRKYRIYAYLLSKNFIVGDQMRLLSKIHNLDDEKKAKIDEENSKLMKIDPENFLNILACKIKGFPSHDLHEMLLRLNAVEELNQIMKITTTSITEITFEATPSSCFKNGRISIESHQTQSQTYGDFARELCRYAMFLVYENRGLPYCKGDTESETMWTKSVDKIRCIYEDDKITEEIIKNLFKNCESKQQQEAEIVALIPQLSAFYYDDLEEIERFKALLPDLFHAFNDSILPDLKIPHLIATLQLNNKFAPSISSQVSTKKAISTPKEDKKLIFSSNIPKLTLASIHGELTRTSHNKLHVKARNLFVNIKKLETKKVREDFKDLIRSGCVERVIVDAKNIQEEDFKFFGHFKDQTRFLIVIDEKTRDKLDFLIDDYGYKTVTCTYEWDDFTDESKSKILNKMIKYQGKDVKLCDVLNFNESFSSDLLKILSSDGEICINCGEKFKIPHNFINLKVEESNYNESSANIKSSSEVESFFTAENSLKVEAKNFQKAESSIKITKSHKFVDLAESQAKVVLISDIAGSGKTTILRKIHEDLIKKCPSKWVAFVDLKSILQLNLNLNCDNFVKLIQKTLKLDELSAHIFNDKFMIGDVVMLFDGFDELSHSCKENAIKIFKILQDNQIYVATRFNHLENALNVASYSFKNPEKSQIFEFFIKTWKDLTLDLDLMEKCASLSAMKLSEIYAQSTVVVGMPLSLSLLAEILPTKINSNFEEFIDKLSIFNVFSEIVAIYLKNDRELTKFHQHLAIKVLFDEKFAVDFETLDEIPSEIRRAGFIAKESQFKHKTFAEFFLSSFLHENVFKGDKKVLKSSLKMLTRVLTEERFQVTRMFLDKMLELDQQVPNHSEFSTENREILTLTSIEGLSNLFLATLSLIGKKNLNFYEQILTTKNCSEKVFIRMLKSEKEDKKVLNLVEEFLSVESVAKKLLFTENHEFFAVMISRASEKALKFFIGKMFDFINHQTFRDYNFKFKNYRNVLHLAAQNTSPSSMKFFISFVESEFCVADTKKMLSELDKFDNSALHLVLMENTLENLKFLFAFYEKFFTKEEMKNYLNLILRSKGAFSSIVDDKLEIIKIFATRYEVNFTCQENYFENFIGLLENEAAGFDEIEELWNIIEKTLFRHEILDLIKKKNHDESSFLHYTTRDLKSQEFLWKITKDLYGSEENFKHFLLAKNKLGQNSLVHSIAKQNETSFKFLFENVFYENFELQDFIFEVDRMDENFFHKLARFGSVSMLELALFKLRKELSRRELKDFLKLKNKICQNILHLCTARSENSIEFLLSIVEKDFDREELKEMMCEKDLSGNLPLHLVVKANSFKVFEVFWRFYERIFNKTKIETFLLAVEENNKNIFDLIYEKHDKNSDNFFFELLMTENLSKFKKFWSPIKKSLKNESNLRNFLLKKTQSGTIVLLNSEYYEEVFGFLFSEVYAKLFDFKDFIHEVDINGNSVLHVIVRNESLKMVKMVFAKLNQEEIKVLIDNRNKNNENLMKVAEHNSDKEVFDFLRNSVLKRKQIPKFEAESSGVKKKNLETF